MKKFLLLVFTTLAVMVVHAEENPPTITPNVIQAFDPTKVLVNITTGQVIFIPRELDYRYGLDQAIDVPCSKKGSLKRLITGKCSKNTLIR